MTTNNKKNYGELSFECLGISSSVITHATNNLHVLFYDIEGQMIGDVRQEAQKHDNYFIFQSSPFNYHIIVPVVMPKEKVIEYKSQSEIDDVTHLEVGDRRDSWVLRVTDKGEKDKPQLVDYQINGRSPNTTFSRPHLDIIKTFHDVEFNVPERKCVGIGLTMDQYWTY